MRGLFLFLLDIFLEHCYNGWIYNEIMKTIYTVHGVGFEVSDTLSERVRFVEHEALEDIQHKLAEENDITFISLGGLVNEKEEKNAHVAYDLLQEHKDSIPEGSQIITLGGESFMAECLEVVQYIKNAFPNEKVRVVTGVEDTPFRPFRLKLAYKVAFVLYPAVDFASKHPKLYRVFAPILSIGSIFMPFISGKLEVGYYSYPFIKRGGWIGELMSVFKLFWNPLKSVLGKEEKRAENKEQRVENSE